MVLVTRCAVRIERPPEEVWRFVADLENYPRYFPGIVEMRSADDLPPGSPGKRYAEVARVPLRGEERIAVELVEAVPGERLAFVADLAPVRPRFDLRLRDVGDGHTELRWSCRARNEALWVRASVLPLMARVLAGRAAVGLENLKRLLETGRERMRAMRLERFGAPAEALSLVEDAPLPTMSPDDVLVRVVASSVNPIDCRRRGGYGRRLFARRGARLPLVLGRDVSGVVECAGSAVRRFRPGEAVWGAVDGFRDGAWAEFVAVHQRELAAKPASLDYEQAAALPYVGVTTWSALVGRAGLTPGNAAGRRVLVHAGSGGVGSFAIQLLKAWGAWVATTCSTRNVELVTSLGADRVIDYTRQDFSRELRDLDLVFDTLGGEAEAPSLGVLAERRGAAYVSVVHPLIAFTDRFGLLPGAAAAVGLLTSRKLAQRILHGRGYHWSVAAPDGRALAEIGQLVEAGKIRPVIDRTYPFEALPEAHTYSESNRARGKIIIRIAKNDPQAL
jgi:NADPH:quinone reductase-like Zn-dependent oxidoreductase/uncharacterized protein YndB with AHSA1/START domain